jgi:hypothetical protein
MNGSLGSGADVPQGGSRPGLPSGGKGQLSAKSRHLPRMKNSATMDGFCCARGAEMSGEAPRYITAVRRPLNVMRQKDLGAKSTRVTR